MKKNILRKHNFVAEVTFVSLDMILEEEVTFSTVSKFSILPNTQSRKLGYLGQFFLLQTLKGVVTQMQKQQQNLLRQKLKGRDMLLLEKVKTFEVSELSILSYYHIPNLGKCCFTSNFESRCNLRCKKQQKIN